MQKLTLLYILLLLPIKKKKSRRKLKIFYNSQFVKKNQKTVKMTYSQFPEGKPLTVDS